MAFVTGFPAYFAGFLHMIATMPYVAYAVIIALFFGITTASKPGLVLVPAVAALVFIAAKAVVPVVAHHSPLVVPALDAALAAEAVAAYIVFLIAGTAVYAVKRAVLKVID